MRSAVIDYLSLGFVPDAEVALRYLRDLSHQAEQVMASEPDIGNADPKVLLTSIVADELNSNGKASIALPLTSGFDSRGLLGACLNILPSERIHCYTIGSEDHSVCKRPSEVCGRLGIRWTRIDPNSIHWELDEVVDIAKRMWEKGDAYIDTFGAGSFAALVREIPEECVVLSGYLGGVVSGAHLRGGYEHDSRRRYVARHFVEANSTKLGLPSGRQALINYFLQFLNRVNTCFPNMRGVTNYDLLDFGFRQRLWICSLTKLMFPNCVVPYENPRWFAYWMNQDFTDRIYQKKYKAFLASSFPDVFGELSEMPGRARMRKKLASFEVIRKIWISSAAKRIRGRFKREIPGELRERGDPRTVPSLERMMRSCAQSFDRRKILPKYSALKEFESLMKEPTVSSWAHVKWMVCAEVQIRAGNIDPNPEVATVSLCDEK